MHVPYCIICDFIIVCLQADFYVGDEANVGIEIQGQGGNEIRQGPRAVAQRIQDQIIRKRYGHIPEGNLDAN